MSLNGKLTKPAARGENLIYIKPPIEYSLQIPTNL